jgi:hypothetical protein
MKNNDMRSLLGIMRNHTFLIKEDDTQINSNSNEQTDGDTKMVVTNINDNDKNDILNIINSIKMYRIFIRNLEKIDEQETRMILINGTYTHDNTNYSISMKIGGDRQSSTIDIDSPRPLVFDANSESTLFDFYSLLYKKFKEELFEKCSSMLGNNQDEQI